MLGPDNVHGAQAAGYYDDVVVQTDDGWKIARRRYTMVRMQVTPARVVGEKMRAVVCETVASRSARPPIPFPAPVISSFVS